MGLHQPFRNAGWERVLVFPGGWHLSDMERQLLSGKERQRLPRQCPVLSQAEPRLPCPPGAAAFTSNLIPQLSEDAWHGLPSANPGMSSDLSSSISTPEPSSVILHSAAIAGTGPSPGTAVRREAHLALPLAPHIAHRSATASAVRAR